MSTGSRRLVAARECPSCKEMLNIYETDDGPVAIEQASEKVHKCWDLPAGAELIVMDETSREGRKGPLW